jgi:hypothetical protein
MELEHPKKEVARLQKLHRNPPKGNRLTPA